MMQTTIQTGASWQLVLVLWGTKYGVDEVNKLITNICEKAALKPRVVLITDRVRPGLLPNVITRDFPPFYLNPILQTGGCQAKLVMFAKGVLPVDLPAVYIDIDTLVLGDLSQFLNLMKTPQTLALFQSAIVPFGPVGRFLWNTTNKKRYARGNSSLVVFHPGHCHYISTLFEKLFVQTNGIGLRPMIADERFMSWAAQPHARALPSSWAVKFPTEFMWRWRWLSYLRAKLPHLRRRWTRLIVITLPGLDFKGPDLVDLADGTELIDRKGRRLIWSKHALGPVKQMIIDYYTPLKKINNQ